VDDSWTVWNTTEDCLHYPDEENNSAVRNDGYLSGWFQVVTGVRQGCILSPLLFAITTDWVLVLLRFSKSHKRMVSDGFVKKSADSDSVSDSRRRHYKLIYTGRRAQRLSTVGGKCSDDTPPTATRCAAAQTAAASTASDNYLKLRSDVCLDRCDDQTAGRGGSGGSASV